MRGHSWITRTILFVVLAVPVFAALGRAEEFARPLAIGPGGVERPAIGSDSVPQREPMFKVRGSKRGLYPGRKMKMRLRVRNPNPYPIVVRRIKATVHSSQVGCSSRRVRTKPWIGSRRIAPHGRIRMWMRIRMVRGAPDACQGVRFKLRYGGKAVRP